MHQWFTCVLSNLCLSNSCKSESHSFVSLHIGTIDLAMAKSTNSNLDNMPSSLATMDFTNALRSWSCKWYLFSRFLSIMLYHAKNLATNLVIVMKLDEKRKYHYKHDTLIDSSIILFSFMNSFVTTFDLSFLWLSPPFSLLLLPFYFLLAITT